jgi:hypothetical protein
MEIRPKTVELALGALAHTYRLSLDQYGVAALSRNGVEPEDLDQPGTWIERYGKAVAELWERLGPKEGQYVLAQEIDNGGSGDARYRRYRIAALDEAPAIGTAAWSGADERGQYAIDMTTAIYIG